MASHVLLKTPSIRPSGLRIACQFEGHAGRFLRQSACKRSDRSFATLPTSRRSLYRGSNIQNLRETHAALLIHPFPSCIRRWKSKKAKSDQKKEEDASEPEQLLGDDPPLYDKKPPLWARWIFALLALDVLFTGLSVDMVVRKWTHLVPDASQDTSTSDSSSPAKKYELRPLWHRLSLATFEIIIGAAAGALILASRDRTVWRIRVRRVPINSLQSGMRPPPSASGTSKTINVMTLETGSGRKKRFYMRDCVLKPGRDLSELILGVEGIRTNFLMSMNKARVLGSTADDIHESVILKNLRRHKTTEEDLTSINTCTPGGVDVENVHIADLRKALAHAWCKLGGTVGLPKVVPAKGAWTSGPVIRQR